MITEETKPYVTLYVPYTKEEFDAKLAAIDCGGRINVYEHQFETYCTPIIDVDGVYWMIVTENFLVAFTELELSKAVELSEIKLRAVKAPKK